MTGCRQDAEEAYQDAFVKVFRYAGRFRGDAPFRPWLYRIATNCCRDLLRKRRRHDAVRRIPASGDEHTPLDERMPDPSQDPRAQAAAREAAERLEAAVAALPLKQRAVFLMARVEGMTYAEIAKALRTPVGTVKSRMNAAGETVDGHLTRGGTMTGTEREKLRRYALGTLSKRAMRRVEARLESDADWARALEEERSALDALDALEDLPAPEHLDARVLAQIAEMEQPQTRPRFAAIFAAAAAVCIAAFLLHFGYGKWRDEEYEHLAQMHLKQIGLSLKMYSNETKGERFPPLAPYGDCWALDLSRLYPEYLTDITVFAAPNRPGYIARAETLQKLVAEDPPDWERINRLAGEYFIYTGWTVSTPEDARKLVAARMQLASAQYDDDLPTQDWTFYRLREGIERFLIQDINNAAATASAQSDIPVIMQIPPDTGPRQSDVLFMDGHVESVAWSDGGSPLAAIIDALLDFLPRPPE